MTVKKLPRIVFFGTPGEAVAVIEELIKCGYPVVGAVSKNGPTPVARYADMQGLPLITANADPDKPWLFAEDLPVSRRVLACKPELLVTADFTLKIPASLISSVKYGGLNLHPSLLPSYRGPAPVQWAILNGETKTGISVITLADKFDQGQLIGQAEELILPDDTTPVLMSRLFSQGAKLITHLIPGYISGRPPVMPNTNYKPSYYPRLKRADGYEPWENITAAFQEKSTAIRIERKIRAFTPWPGVWTTVSPNKTRLKIITAHIEAQKLVADKIQIEGRPVMSEKDSRDYIARRL